jgi:hypothetical protein
MLRQPISAAAIAIAAAALLGGPTLAIAGASYNAKDSAWVARNWAIQASALAPQTSAKAAENPYGPTLITSRPVPDTPRNRARLGEPMSRAGKLTPAIGD